MKARGGTRKVGKKNNIQKRLLPRRAVVGVKKHGNPVALDGRKTTPGKRQKRKNHSKKGD